MIVWLLGLRLSTPSLTLSLSALGKCLSPGEQWGLLESWSLRQVASPGAERGAAEAALGDTGGGTLRPPAGVSQPQNYLHCPLVASPGPHALQKHSLASG